LYYSVIFVNVDCWTAKMLTTEEPESTSVLYSGISTPPPTLSLKKSPLTPKILISYSWF